MKEVIALVLNLFRTRHERCAYCGEQLPNPVGGFCSEQCRDDAALEDRAA